MERPWDYIYVGILQQQGDVSLVESTLDGMSHEGHQSDQVEDRQVPVNIVRYV